MVFCFDYRGHTWLNSFWNPFKLFPEQLICWAYPFWFQEYTCAWVRWGFVELSWGSRLSCRTWTQHSGSYILSNSCAMFAAYARYMLVQYVFYVHIFRLPWVPRLMRLLRIVSCFQSIDRYQWWPFNNIVACHRDPSKHWSVSTCPLSLLSTSVKWKFASTRTWPL